MRSSQCAGYKHHYEECVERVTYQHEHPEEFKGHKEDCVEECTIAKPNSPLTPHCCLHSPLTTPRASLPPPALCNPMRCAQALQDPQVELFVSNDRYGWHRRALACHMPPVKLRYKISKSLNALYSHLSTLARLALTASVSIV